MDRKLCYRNFDKEIEKEISRYCDKHMYVGEIEFKRCYDITLQKSGVDGFLTIESLGIKDAMADEKASAHYVNNPIKTYLMELSQITSAGDEVDGWFLSKDSKTEYYILMYIWALVPQTENNGRIFSDWKSIKDDNITLVEYFIVKKSDIFSYLEKCGFDEGRLRDAVRYLRENNDVDRVNTEHGFKFVISRKFKECPVNVCIERDVYKKICKMHGFAGKFDN